MVIDNETDDALDAVQPLIQRKIFISNYPRLMVIEKYTPKLLRENLHSFCLLKL